ncbi:hypothetical protein OIU77_027803 [Salix suchowensis]|uniref:Survival protein SurE-like phosphatase/nucleotidase domain-containing protein n=1 Tax=Salix suchowensis TaxID=1278906 RepID=A0ABQ9BTF5_9ROSI|nr:hypothetical protein OIU77_027803 [Salix suchowensis]
MFYSGVVAGAIEALICGVPSLSISLNWKKEESQDSDFMDAVAVCLPVINSAIRDIEKGVFPQSCSLNIEIPTSPSTNKVSTLMYFADIAENRCCVLFIGDIHINVDHCQII